MGAGALFKVVGSMAEIEPGTGTGLVGLRAATGLGVRLIGGGGAWMW